MRRHASSARTSKRRSSGIICTARGTKPSWRATMFQTGSNTWKTYDVWPPKGATPTNLYFHSGRHAVVRQTGVHRRRLSRVSLPIRRVRCRTGSGRSHRPIRTATGAAGRMPTSDSSTVVPMCSRHECAARSRRHRHRRPVGNAVCVDVRHRRGLRRQADRRLSGECAAQRVEPPTPVPAQVPTRVP
jgi:hypothetical protein